jgi:hypothetical protein
MGLLDFLFGPKRGIGPIYSMASVKPELRRVAEDAMAENRYDVEVRNGPDRFAVRLHTQPPLRAVIKMDHSLGKPPAMIIAAVYPIN